ncbi:MAG: thiamine phosphate synthase [Eubacteriales bacterium]|nr:thiamine phosphate synthase [Eubacteriales bacterium]
MDQELALQMLRRAKLVAIIRGIPADAALNVARALFDGGVRVLEFTFDHDDAQCMEHNAQRVRAVTEAYGDDLLVGCGTVLTAEEVDAGYQAGARLMISPDTSEAVIRRTLELGCVSMPGALTPTEIVAAHKLGAHFVKLFPAGVLGAGYIRAVRAPLMHIAMTAVGGVRPDNVAEFLDAGVAGFGVGGELVNRKAVLAGDMAAVTARAQAFVKAVAAWEETRA